MLSGTFKEYTSATMDCHKRRLLIGSIAQWVFFFSFVLFFAFWSVHLYLMLSKSSLKLFSSFGLKAGRALLQMSHPCQESQGFQLIPSFYLLSCYTAKSCCSFCLLLLSAFGPVSFLLSSNLFQPFFSLEIGFFCIALVFSRVF